MFKIIGKINECEFNFNILLVMINIALNHCFANNSYILIKFMLCIYIVATNVHNMKHLQIIMKIGIQ